MDRRTLLQTFLAAIPGVKLLEAMGPAPAPTNRMAEKSTTIAKAVSEEELAYEAAIQGAAEVLADISGYDQDDPEVIEAANEVLKEHIDEHEEDKLMPIVYGEGPKAFEQYGSNVAFRRLVVEAEEHPWLGIEVEKLAEKRAQSWIKSPLG